MTLIVIKRRPEMTQVLAEHRLRKNLDAMIEAVTEDHPYGTPLYEEAVEFLKTNVMLVLARLDGEREEVERLRAENETLLARLSGHHETNVT